MLGPLILALQVATASAQPTPLRVFISVDMEGIGGVGTSAMTTTAGKDYQTARELMTGEVNAVVDAILEQGAAEILVNDSHGDMQKWLVQRRQFRRVLGRQYLIPEAGYQQLRTAGDYGMAGCRAEVGGRGQEKNRVDFRSYD